MSNYSGADLSMQAPLLAREKVKDGQHRVLCGVQSCPEVLAKREGWSVEISAGYDWGKDHILIKTRRAAARQSAHREVVEYQIKPQYEDALYKTKDSNNPTVTDAEHRASTDNTTMRTWFSQIQRTRSPHTGPFLEFDTLPVLIRCVRCGRLSKIVEAKQRS